MQKLFDRFRQDIDAFVEQRDDLLLIVSCADADAALVAQTIGDIEKMNQSDIFLVFPDNFTMTAPYVSVVVERFKEQYRLANQALEEEGKAPLPPLPEALSDDYRPPFDRLRDTIDFARSLVPPEDGHRLIWAMTPLEIADRTAYLKLVTAFIPWQGIEPWMRGVRIICRDLPQTMQLAPSLQEAPRTRQQDADLGPDAIVESFAEEVEDEDLPMEQRMQSLLSMAMLDYAHGRPGQAMTKFEALLGYYQHTENLAMQALVLNGMGDINHRADDLVKAQHWYECALTPVVEGDSPVIFLMIVRNLGEVSYKMKQYPEAEEYFDGADKLAEHLKDPQSKAHALEWRGLSQEQQHKFKDAAASWEDAATLSRSVGMDAPLKAVLEHLIRIHERFGVRDKIQEYRRELDDLKRQEELA